MEISSDRVEKDRHARRLARQGHEGTKRAGRKDDPSVVNWSGSNQLNRRLKLQEPGKIRRPSCGHHVMDRLFAATSTRLAQRHRFVVEPLAAFLAEELHHGG